MLFSNTEFYSLKVYSRLLSMTVFLLTFIFLTPIWAAETIDFSTYTPGNLSGADSWTTIAYGSTGPLLVSSAPSVAQVRYGTNYQQVGRPLTPVSFATAGNKTYSRFDLKVLNAYRSGSGNGDYILGFSLVTPFSGTSYDRIYIKKTANGLNFTLGLNAGVAAQYNDDKLYSLNTDYTIVITHEAVTGIKNDKVSLSIKPLGGYSEDLVSIITQSLDGSGTYLNAAGVNVALPSAGAAINDPTEFKSMSLFQRAAGTNLANGQANNSVDISKIVIGNSLVDIGITPAPPASAIVYTNNSVVGTTDWTTVGATAWDIAPVSDEKSTAKFLGALTGNLTANNAVPYTLNALSINSTGSSTLALTGAALTFTTNTATPSPTSPIITLANASSISTSVENPIVLMNNLTMNKPTTTAGTSTFSGIISGTGSIEKIGLGSMSLSAVSNSFSGGVQIKSGEVRVNTIGNTNDISSLGTAGTISLGDGLTTGTLRWGDSFAATSETSNKIITMPGTSGGGTLDISGTNALTLNGAINTGTDPTTRTLRLTGNGLHAATNQSLVINGLISGKAKLLVDGTGTRIVTFGNSNNNFDGGLTIAGNTNGFTISVALNAIGNTAANSPIGTAGTIHLGSTSATAYNSLRYTGPGETTNKVLNLAGTIGPVIIINKSAGLLKFTSPVTATGIGIKTLFADQDDLNGIMEFAGAIPNSSGGATTLKKNGPGTLILSATNTFTGGVSIKGGTLELGTSSALPSSDVKFVADGTGNGMLKIAYTGTGPILANLDVDVNATIDLGTNSNSSIKFQTAAGWVAAAVLTVTNTSGGKLYIANASGLDLSKIKSSENPTYLARLGADGLLSFISPAPVVTANQAFSITERAVASTTVGVVLATDPQSNPISGYSLVSGNTDTAFTINPSTGQISVLGPLNYWGKRYYSLGVSVSNGTYSSSVETVMVTVMGYYTVPNCTYVQLPNGEVLTTINDTSGSIATLQAAINAARISNPSRQIMIKLKAGARYVVSNLPLTLGSNMSLSGTSSCIVANSSTTAPTLIKITNGSNMVSINNLTLEGALANLYGIEALGVSRINIDQVTIRRTILDGILLEGMGSTTFDNEMTITRCDVSECTNASGIHIKNATQAVCSENLSTYNLRGILLELCTHSTLLNNQVEYNSSSGISLVEDTWCKVANNRCHGNGIGISTNGTSASNQYNFLVSNIFQNSTQGISLSGYANVLYGNSFTTNVTLPVKIVTGSGVNRILTTSNAFSVTGQDYFHPPTATNPHSEAIMNGRSRTDLITSASSLSAIQTLYNVAKITNPNNVFVLHLTASQINGDSTLLLDSNTCVILDGTINLNPGILAFSSASSSYISLSGGVINGANTTGRHGIDFENCSRILIEKMSFLNFGSKVTRIQDSDVILLSGCTTPCVIDSCVINGGAARGIWTKGNSVNSTAGLIFVNNSISNVNMDGIDFDVTTSGSLALDNLCQANIRYGIFVEEGAKNNQVIGNTCLSNEIGINVISNVVGDTIQNSFISNTCTSNQRGIRFGASSALETSHNFAFNNSILNSTASGIDAQGAGIENYCSQTYFSGNALNLNATTSSVFFNSPSTTTLRPATVSLGNLAQAYDGTSKSVSVSTNPLGLSVVLKYNDLPSAPSLPGSYSVFATINDAIYQGTATATLVISDGIANWRTNYFQTSENSGQAADGFDADGDSLVNSVEYACGSDPTVQSSSQLLTITKNGGGFLLNFNAKQASGTGYIGLTRTYTVETTNDLTSPSSWSPLAGYANIVGANQAITINLSSITAKCFYRLKVHVE